MQSVLGIATPVYRSAADVERELSTLRGYVAETAAQRGPTTRQRQAQRHQPSRLKGQVGFMSPALTSTTSQIAKASTVPWPCSRRYRELT